MHALSQRWIEVFRPNGDAGFIHANSGCANCNISYGDMYFTHKVDITWAQRRLKSPANSINSLFRIPTKKPSKGRHYWMDRFPHRGSVLQEAFPYHHVINSIVVLCSSVEISYEPLLVFNVIYSLQWRHNGRHSVSNHQPHDCFLNRLFKRRSKKTSKLRVTDLCAGNSQVTGKFPAQRASNAENVSIWWRHHDVRGWLEGVLK